MYKFKLLSIFAWSLLLLAGLSGCGKSAPSCSDSATTDLVLQIFNDKGNGRHYGQAATSLENIRVIDKNDKTGSYTCAASMVTPPRPSGAVDTVKYTTELTSDGKIYVQAQFDSNYKTMDQFIN